MNQGIHFVDMMRYLGGEVEEVVSMLGTQARDMECEDTGSALLRFESGALGNIFVTMAGPSDLEGSVTVIGQNGMVKLGGVAMNKVEYWKFAEPVEDKEKRFGEFYVEIDSVYGAGHQGVYHQVAYSLSGEVHFPLGLADARRSVETVLDIYTSCSS